MNPLAIVRNLLLREKRPNEPSGRALRRARSIAFIVSSPAEAGGQVWIDEASARGATVDILPMFQPYRRDDGKAMSFVFTPPRDAYDCIVVNRSIELFEHSWSYAFLDRLNMLLAPGGTIFVPRCLDITRQMPDATLAKLFGRGPRAATKRYLVFAKATGGLNRPASAALSTLDAYWPLMDALIHAKFDERLAGIIRSLGVDDIDGRRQPDAGKFLDLLQSQSYRTSSAATKSAMMQFIAGAYFPGRRDLRLADLGAGTGLNSLELLLNPSGVSHLTLVEPRRDYHWDIAAVYDWLGESVRGKVSLVGERVETFAGEPVDIAMVCGVFSILLPEQREAFVQSAWSNVAPGGILAVLENMRDADPVRGGAYNATRFSPPEIDAFLGRMGQLRYFLSDSAKELPFAEVGNRTVFRVVRKPS